jgi:hypothetical protein
MQQKQRQHDTGYLKKQFSVFFILRHLIASLFSQV